MKDFLTDEQVEMEIKRLSKSEDVKLARIPHRLEVVEIPQRLAVVDIPHRLEVVEIPQKLIALAKIQLFVVQDVTLSQRLKKAVG